MTTDSMDRRSALLTWVTMLGATLFYAAVLLLQERCSAGSPPSLPLLGGSALAGLILALLCLAIPSRLRRQQLREPALATVVVADEAAVLPQCYRIGAPTRRAFAHPAAALRRAFHSYGRQLVLALTLAELIALEGLVLGLMGVSLLWAAPFFALSWLLFALWFPTACRALAPLERAYGAQLRP